MEVKSTYKYARISPKKARDVARAIQGMPVSEALDALAYTPRKAAELIGKTLKSAVANAENNHELIADDLTIKEATVGDGPTFKRFKPRARGSAGAIRKRTSHLYIILTDEEEILEPRERSSKPKKRDQKASKKAAPKAKKEAAAEVKEEAAATDAADLALGTVYDTAPDKVDDLKVISGVGPAIEEKLHGFGIYTYEQIANWNDENIAAFDQLLSFKGRIERDDWLAQAKDLMNNTDADEAS